MKSRLTVILLAASALALPLFVISSVSAAQVGAPQARFGHAAISGLPRGMGVVRELRGGTLRTSPNWAGYDVTGGGFRSVSATWIQPEVQPDYSIETRASFWVGLDGWGSSTVEQTGTEGISEDGIASYYAWYEMYPAPEVRIVGLFISPGNEMTGTVTTDGYGDFTLTITDNTTGWYHTIREYSGAAQDYSAEVIAEAPTDLSTGNLWPLANFGTVDFTNCSIDGFPIGPHDWNRINMVSNSGSTLATASPLGSDGAGFFVSTDVTPPTTSVSGADGLWHNQPVTLTFSATDNPGGSGIAYTEYSLDGGVTWTQGASVTIPAPADHSNDGVHTVLYRSVDNAGNVETAKSCQVMINTTPPTTSVTGADANWHNTPVTLTFSATDAGSGVASTQYSVDGGPLTTGATLTIAAPADHSNDGIHTLSYRSVDNAGNVEATQSCQVRIDTLGPVCSATSLSVARGHMCTIWYAVRDNLSPQVTSTLVITSGSGVVEKHWSWGYSAVPRQGYWWTQKYRCTLAKGTYVICVYGKDLAGNPQSVIGTASLRVK